MTGLDRDDRLSDSIVTQDGSYTYTTSKMVEAIIQGSTTPCNKVYLLSIPQEIRDMIYELTLVSHTPIKIWGNRWSFSDESCEIRGGGLVRTCKQLRSECELHIFKHNTFQLECDFGANRHEPVEVGLCDVVSANRENASYGLPGDIVRTLSYKFPIEKVQKLELRLTAPDSADVLLNYVGPRRGVPRYCESLCKHLHRYFKQYIHKCVRLEKLHVEFVDCDRIYQHFFMTEYVLDDIKIPHRQIDITLAVITDIEEDQPTMDFEERIVEIVSTWTEKTVSCMQMVEEDVWLL